MKRQDVEVGHKSENRKASFPAKKKVLVVDDDPGIRDIFSIILKRAGYSIELKSNGNDLLHNKFILPHIFLIDKQLSGTDGLDLCRFLKRQKNTRHIPVIMISASPGIGKLSLAAGADNFLEKPFEIKDLLRMVDHYITLDEKEQAVK